MYLDPKYLGSSQVGQAKSTLKLINLANSHFEKIMFSISFVVLVAVLAVVSAKLVEVRQNVLVMNEKDRIVGKTEHVFQRDVLKATPPPLPGKNYAPLLL